MAKRRPSQRMRALAHALQLHRIMKRQHFVGGIDTEDEDPGEKKWIRKWKKEWKEEHR